MNGAIARIVLRYVAGFVIGPAVGAALANDPDVVNLATIGVGIAIAALSEGWYWLAKRFGWST